MIDIVKNAHLGVYVLKKTTILSRIVLLLTDIKPSQVNSH